MTDHFTLLVLWCVVQVTTTACIGLVVSAVLAKRRPAAAAAVVCTTAAVVALLTVSAPLPVHRAFVVDSSTTSSQSAATGKPRATEQPADIAHHPDKAHHAATPLVGLRQIVTTIQSVAAQAREPGWRHHTVAVAVVWCLLVATVIGIGRLCLAVAAVAHMKTAATRIENARLSQVVDRLSATIRCSGPTAGSVHPQLPVLQTGFVRRTFARNRAALPLCESRQLSSAAVVGWFRPTLILPAQWRSWTDDELHAVIAHELAHVVRRDAVWRALVAGVSALHWGNPVIHWLLRRVVLYQELSADVLASEAVGHRRYLKSLSNLAIQRDDQIQRQGRPELVPVFSGELIRRIKMLSTNGRIAESTTTRRRTFATTIVSAVVAAVGLAGVAVRGLAEPPEDSGRTAGESPKRVARVESDSDNPVDFGAASGLFGRDPLDPSVIGLNNTGMAVLRVRELLERPGMQSYAAMMNGALSGWLATTLRELDPRAEVPSVDLSVIELIAGQTHMTIRTNDDKPVDHDDTIMFGGSQFVIKLSQPVDLKAWFERHLPSTTRMMLEDREVFRLPVIPAIGPIGLAVTQIDDVTILANVLPSEFDADTPLRKVFQMLDDAERAETPSWASAWNRSDGGLGTFLVTDINFHHGPAPKEGETELETVLERTAHSLHSRSSVASHAFDIDPGASRVGVRLRYTHATRDAADDSARELQTLARMVVEKSAGSLISGEYELTPADKQWYAVFDQAVREAGISVDELKDGSADVVIAVTFPFESIVAMYLNAIVEESREQSGLREIQEAKKKTPSTVN